MNRTEIVLHSGGMDSSICLLLAAQEEGKEAVISVGFRYHQRHIAELQAAEVIAHHYGIRRIVIDVPDVPGWETSSLISPSLPIQQIDGLPNSFVVGRNGLFLMMTVPLAKALGVSTFHMGVMERDGSYSGYPDCSRQYIDSVQAVIRLDLQNPLFVIKTPLMHMSKAETLEVADSLGVLEFLLQHTVSCYNGIPLQGCTMCPSCRLRNEGIAEFVKKHGKKAMI